MRTILYGSQTSLGKAWLKREPRAQAVDGTADEYERVIHAGAASKWSKGGVQLLCVDGINHLSRIGETRYEDKEILMRNVFNPYMFVNELVKMDASPMRCVFVVSQTYKVPQRTTSLYCASKAGLAHMVKVMARELAPKGWIINGLAPGKITDTRMAKLTDAQVLKLRGWKQKDADRYALSMIPAGRFTNTNEVCDAIEWLFKAPDYINGTIVDMTGGV